MSVRTAGERKALMDAVGLALVFMFRTGPALAGSYLDRLVEEEILTADEAMVLMDALREYCE